jgi:hypothetical protein
MTVSTLTRERFLLLHDLRRQLPRTRGPLRVQTERAIKRLEWELAPGRGAACRAQRRLDLREVAK